MARRTTPLEGIIVLAARTRWWIVILLAFATFLIFHWLATLPAPKPGNLAAVVLKPLGFFLQYLAPALLLTGIPLGMWQRKRGEALISRAAAGEVAKISWEEFEELVAEAFRRIGYDVSKTGGRGVPDGGVDLVLRKDGERHLVQCKHWRAWQVGVKPVRELYGVMTAEGAASGFLVTSGRFTGPAREFATGRNIELVDGAELLEIIHLVRGERAVACKESPAPYGTSPSPVCPRCGATMVRRTARHGPHAGADFLGCSRFPACKGKRPA